MSNSSSLCVRRVPNTFRPAFVRHSKGHVYSQLTESSCLFKLSHMLVESFTICVARDLAFERLPWPACRSCGHAPVRTFHARLKPAGAILESSHGELRNGLSHCSPGTWPLFRESKLAVGNIYISRQIRYDWSLNSRCEIVKWGWERGQHPKKSLTYCWEYTLMEMEKIQSHRARL